MTSPSSTHFLLQLDSPNHLSFFRVTYLLSTFAELTACNLCYYNTPLLRLEIVC